jgi:hypothetical protein
MLKLTVAVLAVALAGTAAAGWRDLRVDASSESAFEQSLAAFEQELSPERQTVFTAALMDIWIQGTAKAHAEEREFTVGDYYGLLDGLSYEEVVTFTDPTGETAKQRYREANRVGVLSTTEAWQNPAYRTQERRAQRAHETLDGAELMRTRQGGQTTPHTPNIPTSPPR